MARAISIPNPFYSDKEFCRYYHYDLGDMTVEDLLCELCAMRCQLWLLRSGRFAYMLSPFEQKRRTQWLQERISTTKTELNRQGYVRRGTARKSKPKLAEGVRL